MGVTTLGNRSQREAVSGESAFSIAGNVGRVATMA